MAQQSGRRRRWFRWLLIALGIAGAIFVVGLVLSILFPTDDKPATNHSLVVTMPNERLILTYFYYWYDLPNGPHSGGLTDTPAESNASYKDPAWFEKQLGDMEDAGIDVALAVYWGDQEPSSEVGLTNMVAAAADLRDKQIAAPRIGMFLDTGAIGRWPEGQRDLTKESNQQRVYGMVSKFYQQVPEDDRATVNGRPLIWLWAPYFGITFDQSTFDYINQHFEAEFGVRPYIVAEIGWYYPIRKGPLGIGTTIDRSSIITVDNWYTWAAAAKGMQDPGGSIAEVGPGYDERELNGPGREGKFTDREGGAFYRRNFDAALQTEKPLVAIETWNEFHEATDIAESVEYGRQYIGITRGYVDRFRSGPTSPPFTSAQ